MFERMISPLIIGVGYYLGSLAIVAFSVYGAYTGMDGIEPVMYIVIGAFSLLVYRLFCELMILPFRIYEVLFEIRNGGGLKPTAPPPRLDPDDSGSSIGKLTAR